MDLIISLVFAAILLAIGYFIGGRNEKKHFESIKQREEALRSILVIPSRNPPDYDQKPYRTQFVSGSVVIAMDSFKVFFGRLIQIFGGRIKTYETLVERARREAVLRMKEEANQGRAQMIFNVKFSTAGIVKDASGQPGGSVEVIAYGTAIIYI